MQFPNYVILVHLLSSSSVGVAAFAPMKKASNAVKNRSRRGVASNDADSGDLRKFQELMGRPITSNPFADTNRPSKSELYQTDELSILWELHQELSSAIPVPADAQRNLDESDIRGLHDVVLQMLGDSGTAETQFDESLVNSTGAWLDDATKARISQIRAIASDVDGTLLTSDQTMHPRTKQAIQEAISRTFSPLDKLQWFFPATGKSRAGALKSLGPDVAKLLSQVPGVFLQGLYCVDSNGEVVFQRKLNILQVEAVEEFAKEMGISIIAYDGDKLLATEISDAIKPLFELYGEPIPQLLETHISEYGPSVNKILLIDLDADRMNNEVRPRLQVLAEEYDTAITQAVPTMLEWLPSGCSKALGVEKLCEKLGINPSTQLLAMGDAENDVGMLKMASIGVAVGNACPMACDAADFVMTETNDEGGAGAAMEVFGFGLY